ncbi:plastocyanin/azurin family copper-binding protein [Geoalkalibacter halelectricus]|uniref:plastocyanin/azurin family copper-binding protein n=1 Tax=Geoalkalibacter halelectricus TaxID=2847045 RepID=UPI003D248DC2
MMKKAIFSKLLLITALVWTLAGCAGKDIVFEAPAGAEEVVVSMKASNFAFDPTVIKAHQGSVLLIEVENVAGIAHNLTIKSPEEKILTSVSLPAGQTVTVQVILEESGTYAYTCDRPMHTTLGMSGRIEVAPHP